MTISPGETTEAVPPDRPVRLRIDDVGAGGDQDEEERAEQFREETPPLVGCIVEMRERR